MEQQTHEPSGLLIIDKHAGVTSHDIVNLVRRAYNTRRVGHTGTLDPMATGVLVALVGRAAKAAEYLVCDRKRYLATLRLGLTTDTEDTTGKLLTENDIIPSVADVTAACAAFCGHILQTPPMYSALKIGGRKLCNIARTGEVVERQARPVDIFNITCTPTDSPTDYSLDVSCSSGTYIRTLCADIGAKLGCGGVMAALKRLEAGGFGLENAVTTDQLSALDTAEREALLLPVEKLFDSLDEIRLPAFYERLCRSGCEIYQKKLHTALPDGARVRLCSESGSFFALGEVSAYPDGSALKAIKLFEL